MKENITTIGVINKLDHSKTKNGKDCWKLMIEGGSGMIFVWEGPLVKGFEPGMKVKAISTDEQYPKLISMEEVKGASGSSSGGPSKDEQIRRMNATTSAATLVASLIGAGAIKLPQPADGTFDLGAAMSAVAYATTTLALELEKFTGFEETPPFAEDDEVPF